MPAPVPCQVASASTRGMAVGAAPSVEKSPLMRSGSNRPTESCHGREAGEE